MGKRVATQNDLTVDTEMDLRYADSALSDPKADRLGYATFAKYLADSIGQMAIAEGYVIAVYGPWGAGKSTILNFLVHYLKQKPEDEQPIIVPFNPWLFSGQDDISRRFFDQFQSVLNQWKFVPKGFKDRIADFAKVVSETPLPYAQAGNAVAKIFDDKQKDTSDLKEEVEHTLRQTHPRIVVTIDDIDRLAADDIKKLFRTIKAFPDFTNVVYFLVLDKDVVVKALAETPEETGEAYLEKVVQFAFDLPLPDKTSLRGLLFEKLNRVLDDAPKASFEQNRWGNVYLQGIDHFITNPRKVVHLINALSLTYPAVKDAVNAVDFIAVESLRVFCPSMYDAVRKNPKFFAGADIGSSSIDVERRLNFWMAEVKAEDREPVKRLLLHLFPKLAAVWGGTYYDGDEAIWRKQLRVCSSEFPLYFRLTLPEGDLPDAEMKAILALAKDAKSFGASLVKLASQKRPDGTTQVRAFLERLEDYTAEISVDCIPSIVQAFFDVGDRLLPPEDKPSGMFDFGNDIRIGRIIEQLLRRQDRSTRFEVFKGISNGKALSIIVREVVTLGQQQGKYNMDSYSPEEGWLVSTQQLEELEKIALKKVQDAASQSLLQTPNLTQVLDFWRQTGDEEVKQWVQKAISDDDGLVKFLEKFFERTFSQSASEAEQNRGYKLDLTGLETYLELPLIIDKIESLTEKSELTEEQVNIVQQLVQAYEVRQQEQKQEK